MRNDAAEVRLLASISERGIEEPMGGGVDTPHGHLLLDVFRRNRCAPKLGCLAEKREFISPASEKTVAKTKLAPREANSRRSTSATQAIAALCDQLNARDTKFPGTHLRLRLGIQPHEPLKNG